MPSNDVKEKLGSGTQPDEDSQCKGLVYQPPSPTNRPLGPLHYTGEAQPFINVLAIRQKNTFYSIAFPGMQIKRTFLVLHSLYKTKETVNKKHVAQKIPNPKCKKKTKPKKKNPTPQSNLLI